MIDQSVIEKAVLTGFATLLHINLGIAAMGYIYGREVGQEQAKTNPYDLVKNLPWKWSRANQFDMIGSAVGFVLVALPHFLIG